MMPARFSDISRRRVHRAGWGLALVLAAVMTAAAVRAQYVTYYHAFGDWTVVCAWDEPTGRTRCQLGAPPPDLGDGAGRVRIGVVEPPAGETAVTLRIDPVVDASRGVSLSIDGRPPHEAPLTRIGEAGWQGAAARALLDEMAAGRTLTVRFVRRGERTATEHRFALGGFPAAYRTYLHRIGAAEERR